MRFAPIVLMAGVLLAAACKESTGPQVVPATVNWLEWPTAVTASQPGALRVSGSAVCPYDAVFKVVVSGSELHVTAEGVMRNEGFCLLSGTGAGYDTLLPLPRLTASSALPAWFSVWAPVTAGHYGVGRVNERMVGTVELRAAPDTTTRFAGNVNLFADSLGCWRAIPWSAAPNPRWAFAKPVPLAPQQSGRRAFLSGRFVAVSPPVCGESQAIDAFALEVDATPTPYIRSQAP